MRSFRFALLILTAAVAIPARAATFTVAPAGNDANPGTEARPLATVEAARDAARKAGPGPHRIVLMPGDYFLEKTFELGPADNGLAIEAASPGKATLYGGPRVTGWRRDGDRFWSAELPGVKEGTWDFRALVVNGRLAPRARLPESGTFRHKTAFDVRWMSSVGGGWERKPTDQELTTMAYDPKDVPPTLDVRNAEVRVYHMWDESLVGVARNDAARHELIFSTPAKSPPGAFQVKKYVIFNIREGMTEPGQWYLDRSAGKVVYWPLAGEDMARAKVVAPRLERVVRIAGTKKQPVENLTLRGLSLQATTTPQKPGGFGAYAFEGALSLDGALKCTLDALDVGNVGGQGMVVRQMAESRITGCQIHHCGACGVRAEGADTLFARNHVHHVGLYYPSAIALTVSSRADKGFHVYRNEVHDTPYSGIVGSGQNHVIEENLIYRVMLEMQDGGAIYGGMSRSILRGNMVRDVVKMGEGYGVSSYYLDEGSHDCLVERNVSVGVLRPTHNHIARNTVVRDNVFVCDGDMQLSFARSAAYTFENNTLFATGKVLVGQPSAIKVWRGNRIFREGQAKDGGAQPFTIDDAMPESPRPERKRWGLSVPRVGQAPTIDGQPQPDEWPGQYQRLDRNMARDPASGAPVFLKLCHDGRHLYAAAMVALFSGDTLREGNAWRQDDGIEIAIEGRSDGKPVTFVVRGFAGGASQSSTDAGAPADAAARLAKATRYAAHVARTKAGFGSKWTAEWAIPLDALGLAARPGEKIPFNVSSFRSQHAEWACWEGTLADSWRLDEAGTLTLQP